MKNVSTLVFLVSATALHAKPGLAEAAESPWKFRAGVAWRTLGGTTLKADPANNAAAPGFFAPNPASGVANANDNRTYDDGFVNIGAATPGTGLTTNFGYDDDSLQVVGSILSYSLAGGSALDTPGQSRDGDETESAPYLELVYYSDLSEELELGFVASFSFAGLGNSMQSMLTEYEVTTIDRYDVDGVVLPLGAYNGSFNGPGPLIGNQPSNREQVLTPNATRQFSFGSEIDIYSLGFGSELNWKPAERFFLNLGAGAVVNYVDWSAELSTPLLTGTLRETGKDDEFLFGLYLKAGAGYRITEQISLEGFARYDWNEDLGGSVGSTNFETDLSGWTAGIALGFRF